VLVSLDCKHPIATGTHETSSRAKKSLMVQRVHVGTQDLAETPRTVQDVILVPLGEMPALLRPIDALGCLHHFAEKAFLIRLEGHL
jgi:hypothetical protein